MPEQRPARWRPDWLAEGNDPDYRFSLANERTFLAWIRTSLALLAAAVALSQLVPDFATDAVRTALAVLLSLTAAVLAGAAYGRWARIERAMRVGGPMPYSRLLLVLGATLTVAAVVVTVVGLLRA